MYEPFLNGLYIVLYAFIFERWQNIFKLLCIFIVYINNICIFVSVNHLNKEI